MELLSVNIGQPQEIIHNNKPVMTAIFKQPVDGRVMLRQLNLDGDQQADLKAHGGRDKAVYVYPYEHYTSWAQELGRADFIYGQFGENFTVQGLTEDTVHIGDAFRIGEAFVQVTQPRVPCYKLEHKMGIPGFIRMFHKSERTGFYVQVLEEGEVGAGDSIERVEIGAEQMTVREIHQLLFLSRDKERARRALNIPAFAADWRRLFEKMVDDGADYTLNT